MEPIKRSQPEYPEFKTFHVKRREVLALLTQGITIVGASSLLGCIRDPDEASANAEHHEHTDAGGGADYRSGVIPDSGVDFHLDATLESGAIDEEYEGSGGGGAGYNSEEHYDWSIPDAVPLPSSEMGVGGAGGNELPNSDF